MKGTASCLVIMGTILILAPAIMDYLYQLNYVHAVTAGAGAVVMKTISSAYRLCAIVFGAIMVFVGIGMGFSALERG
mgnify:FL=1